jgi:hypothetical protein
MVLMKMIDDQLKQIKKEISGAKRITHTNDVDVASGGVRLPIRRLLLLIHGLRLYSLTRGY